MSRELQDPDAGSMALRTVIVYAFTLLIVRLGSRRLIPKPGVFESKLCGR